MNSVENSNEHIDMLTEEEEIEQQTEMLPKKEEAPRPHVFNFNKCFVNAGFVAIAGGDLAHVSSQVKMKEEDFMEEFNPWNKDVKLWEKTLNNHERG